MQKLVFWEFYCKVTRRDHQNNKGWHILKTIFQILLYIIEHQQHVIIQIWHINKTLSTNEILSHIT